MTHFPGCARLPNGELLTLTANTSRRRNVLRIGNNHSIVGLARDGQAELVELLAASLTTPSAAFSRDQREQVLQQALSSLAPAAREAIRLRYLENLPSKEIAARLGKSDGAVRVLLTRTLRQLESELAQRTWFRGGRRAGVVGLGPPAPQLAVAELARVSVP